MKALKTVAVALGITLAALIVIPLAVLAGLFVWLKVTEEDDEELLELDRKAPDRHRPVDRPERDARRTGGRRTVRPRQAGVGRSPQVPSTSRDRLLAELARPRRHGRSGRATSSSSRARSRSCRRSVSRSCATASPPLTLLILLRWREGAIRLPRGDVAKILGLGVIGFGCYQILWTVAPPDHPGRRLGAAHRHDPGDDRPAGDGDRCGHAERRSSSSGRSCRSSASALVIAAGQGLDLGASLVGDLLTLVAAACWAVYTVFGATVLRRHSPLVTTTWAIVAGTLFLAPLGIAQLATTGPVAASGCRSCWPSSTPGSWPPASPTSSSSTA